MEINYSFICVPDRRYKIISNKDVQNLICKWSLKDHFSIQSFSFNQPFVRNQATEFIHSFFNDPEVVSSLLSYSGSWYPLGIKAETIEIEEVPCTITSMSFFNRISEPEHNIIRGNGDIVKCFFDYIDGFEVADELRKMLLIESSDNYSLFEAQERQEFIFRLFLYLCLGGQWCQYEDNIKEYLTATKLFYKDLISVVKDADNKNLIVNSVVFKVAAKDSKGYIFFPCREKHIQNFAYLIIDPLNRNVTTFAHGFGGDFSS